MPAIDRSDAYNASRGDSVQTVSQANLIEDRAARTTAAMQSLITGLPSPTNTYTDPSVRMMDYYRDGGTKKVSGSTSTVSISPKEVVPLEFEGPASIRVYGKKKGAKNEGDLIAPYTKFILQSAQEAHQERSQVVETFSDFYVFFYGERPPIYNYSGTLINSKNINWVTDFYYYYENYLRGTKCVETGARLILTYGFRQIEGYMVNFTMQTSAESDLGVPVTFQIIITRRNILGYSSDFGLDTSGEGLTETASLMTEIKKLQEGKGTSDSKISTAYNTVKGIVNV